MRGRKIWLVFCEGKTDRLFLETYNDITLGNDIRVKIYSGDFLMDNENDINVNDVISKLNTKFKSLISSLKSNDHIKQSDISRLIYMTDTDDCFSDESLKANLLSKIINCNEMKVNGKGIDFKVLLMSTNMEHVIIDSLPAETKLLTPGEKEDIMLDFIDEYDTKEKIDILLNLNGKYQYNTYQEFVSNHRAINHGKTNLNVVYID